MSADARRRSTTLQPEGSRVVVQAAVKAYGTKTALDRVDLDVPPGSFCVLLGPSGSGKTTLLRCLAGIERLSGGQIEIAGRIVADGRAHLPPHRRDLSMVFQDYALWPHLTARRNVAFALRRRRIGPAEIARRTQDLLERIGLGALGDRYPSEMSGGEQQRVALARALIGGTGLILFDEPLSNLDADLRERMRLEIATLARAGGATSIYITHDQAEAFALADRIGVLNGGRLVQLGSPEEIYHEPASPFVARFTGLAGEIPVVPVTAEGPADPGGPGSERRPTIAVRPAERGHDGCRPILVPAAPGRGGAGPATLLIRPAGVELLPAGHPERHLDAVVVDRAYRGRGYDHALDVGLTRLIGVHDARPWTRDGRAAVRLRPDGCLLFGDAAGADTTAVADHPPASNALFV